VALPPRCGAAPRLSFFSAFSDAVAAVKALPSEPSNEHKLQLYALFKQATAGPNTTTKPSMFDFVGAAKWAAWKERKGLPQGVAKKVYADVVKQLTG
jgi:acyl-CoA-binding protein